MTYKLNIETKCDYTQMSIMAGELYLVDEKNRKTHISGMVLGEENLHYFFIENDTKFLFIVLENILTNGINNWCTQIAIADIKSETISYYDKYFSNNGEKITYENGIVTVHNDNNEFAKTDSFDINKTVITKTKRFEIFGKHNQYHKRYWNEPRGDMYKDWGESEWLFETDADGNILKQIEIYENGIVQCYDLIKQENMFGGLGKMPLPYEEFREYGIYKEDFDTVWNANNKIVINDLYKHLKTIQHKPAMYLGNMSISKLDSYIHGYNAACYFKGIEEELEPRWHLFHEFAKRKTGFYESTGGWCYMILSQCDGDEEKAINLFFEYFDEFLNGEELTNFIQTLVPKHKSDWDFDKATNILWYKYKEIKPIIPQLLTWLQDINWPVAKPISAYLQPMLPDILEELKPILLGEDDVWKYNILNAFFVKPQSSYWKMIAPIIERMTFNPTENETKEEVDRLAMEIYHSYHIDSEKFNNPNITTIRNLIEKWRTTANDYADKEELIYEWQNDMDCRRLINELLLTLDPAIREKFNIELKSIDDKLKAKTFEVNECIWGTKNELELKYNRKDNWYYYRVNQLVFNDERDIYTKYSP